jgi:DNA repair photolyase
VKAIYREEPCRSALNRVKGMPFGWSLNPYMGCAHRCTFCYVRSFELRAGRPSDGQYGSSIRVKTNIAEVLRRELARKSWAGELVAIGAATDPYQPAEGRYRLTRACLEVLAEASNPLSIISRGPLMVRDIDVLQEASSRADVSVTFSIPTLNDDVWRTTEPGTAHPRNRLRAISMLAKAGINASVGIAPVLPGLSDSPESIDAVVSAARDAGATNVWTRVLYLPPGTREHFLEQLGKDWPDHVPEYEEWYRGRTYLPSDRDAALQKIVRERRDAYGFPGSGRYKARPGAKLPKPPRASEEPEVTAFGRRRVPNGQLALSLETPPQT